MKSILKIKHIAMIITFVFLSVWNTNAQELSLGTDIVNRYIWRGLKAGGESPNIQPNAAFSTGGFTVGFWGAFPFEPAILEEIDFYGSYTFTMENAGGLSLGFTDYMFPNSGTPIYDFSNYDDTSGAGAHFVELNATYSGPESFPISLSFNIFVYNVEHNPIYFQLGYNTSINDFGLGLFLGATPGDDNGYYGVTEFDVINVGFTVSKTISITESFGLPIFGSVITNPASEDLFYVFGVKL
jgi:hypothetical protein